MFVAHLLVVEAAVGYLYLISEEKILCYRTPFDDSNRSRRATRRDLVVDRDQLISKARCTSFGSHWMRRFRVARRFLVLRRNTKSASFPFEAKSTQIELQVGVWINGKIYSDYRRNRNTCANHGRASNLLGVQVSSDPLTFETVVAQVENH